MNPIPYRVQITDSHKTSASHVHLLLSSICILDWRREEFITEEIQRSKEENASIVSRLLAGDKQSILADGMRVFGDLAVWVKRVCSPRRMQNIKYQWIVCISRHSEYNTQCYPAINKHIT